MKLVEHMLVVGDKFSADDIASEAWKAELPTEVTAAIRGGFIKHCPARSALPETV